MNLRKYIAEFIGTMSLVLIGCGSVVGANALAANNGAKVPLAFTSLLIGLAFGLTVTVMAYSVGQISGGHFNTAVSLAMLIAGRMNVTDFVAYVIAQVLGALAGAGLIVAFTGSNASLGTTGYGDASALGINAGVAFLVETVITFLFLIVILGVTSKPEYSNVAGVVIGLTLALLIILALPFTGGSLNPARSFGPALLAGGEALAQVWVFILAPLVGAALAAVVHKFVLAPAYQPAETH